MGTNDEQKLRDDLERARTDFEDRNVVAFLGTRKAGKTVHCALLKDAAVRRLKRHTNGRYIAVATGGSDRINRIMDDLYDGRFPEKTLEGEAVSLTVEISSTENGTDLDLIFHDMAGEEYDRMLTDPMPAGQRIRRLLDTSKIKGGPYGLMTHVVFASIYIILVDCSAHGSWGSSQAYVKDAIRSIYDIKKHVHALHNNRIPSRLAIVFSKYDTLKDDTGVDELAAELDEVDAAVEKYVEGGVRYFKSRLDTVEKSEEEMLSDAMGAHRADLSGAERRLEAHLEALERAKLRAGEAERALSSAVERLDAAKKSENARSARSCQSEYDKAHHANEDAQNKLANLEHARDSAASGVEAIKSSSLTEWVKKVPRDKPAIPLSYNADEYLELIEWMIRETRKASGH